MDRKFSELVAEAKKKGKERLKDNMLTDIIDILIAYYCEKPENKQDNLNELYRIKKINTAQNIKDLINDINTGESNLQKLIIHITKADHEEIEAAYEKGGI